MAGQHDKVFAFAEQGGLSGKVCSTFSVIAQRGSVVIAKN